MHLLNNVKVEVQLTTSAYGGTRNEILHVHKGALYKTGWSNLQTIVCACSLGMRPRSGLKLV